MNTHTKVCVLIASLTLLCSTSIPPHINYAKRNGDSLHIGYHDGMLNRVELWANLPDLSLIDIEGEQEQELELIAERYGSKLLEEASVVDGWAKIDLKGIYFDALSYRLVSFQNTSHSSRTLEVTDVLLHGVKHDSRFRTFILLGGDFIIFCGLAILIVLYVWIRRGKPNISRQQVP